MYTVINDFDQTPNIDPDTFLVDLGLNDNLPTLSFEITDSNSSLGLTPGMEVLVYDENQTDIVSNIPMVPARNLLVNASMNTLGGWTNNGPLYSTIVYGSPGNFQATQTFTNNSVGTGAYYQNTLLNYVQPGQKYTFAYWACVTATMTNCNALAQLLFMDGTGTLIGSATTDTFTSTPSTSIPQRRSISATAPAGAVYAQVLWGGQTTNTTNSGTIVWGNTTGTAVTFQLEPNWFTAEGVTYPTPDLGFYIVGSGTDLPDGTDSRRCRVFAGWIAHLEASYDGPIRTWKVSCTGSGAVFESVNLLNADYTAATYDDTIINNFLTASGASAGNSSYANILTSGQPFNTGPSTTVQRGALIDSTSYADRTLREVLNTLSDTSGFIYFADAYYRVHYNPPYWDVATVQISDNPDYVTSFPPREYKLTIDGTQIKNRIKVTGAKTQAGAITDQFNGNGSNKVFTLSQIPQIITNCTVGGATQKIGVAGVNTNGVGGYTAIYDPSAQTLTFNTAPASGTNNVVITYTYLAPVSVQVQALDSYAKYSNRWWDSKVNDSQLTSTTTAKNRGIAELNKYAYAQITLNFKTDQMLLPGQIVLFTSSHDGYSKSPFLIQKATIRYKGPGENEYEIEAGPYKPDILDHFRNTHKAVNRTQGVAWVNTAVALDLISGDTSTSYSETITTTAVSSPSYVWGTAKWGFAQYS